MRWIETHIDGFGQLYNRSLDLDAPLVIVYGPNEAGKSTLLGYFRAMLYGFARRSSPAERAEPVRGGRHGGRLAFQTSAGERYMLLRYADAAGGRPMLRPLGGHEGLAADAALKETALEQRQLEHDMLGHIHEKLYRSLFAISLTELHEIGMLSGEELGRHLYQAGWEGGAGIAAAEKELHKELDELFRPRSASRKLNTGIKALEQNEAEWRRLSDDIGRFNELRRQEADTEQALGEVAGRLPAVQARLRAARRALSARPAWLRKRQLEAERGRLSYTEGLSPGAERTWEELQRSREDARRRAEELRMELQLLARQGEGLTFDQDILARSDGLRALLQRADWFRTLNGELTEWRSQLLALDESIGVLVGGISPEWTEKRLRQMSMTIAERDYVRVAMDRLEACRRSEERIGMELDGLRAQERELTDRQLEAERLAKRGADRFKRSGEGRFGVFPDSKLALTSAWHGFEEALRVWEVEEAGAKTRNGEKRPFRGMSMSMGGSMLGGAGILLGIPSALGLFGDYGAMGAMAAVALTGGAVGLLFGSWMRGRKAARGMNPGKERRFSRSSPHEGAAESALLHAIGELAKPAAPSDMKLWLSRMGGAGLRSAMRVEVQERLDAIAERDQAMQAQWDAEARLRRHLDHMESRGAAAEQLRQEQDRELGRWRAWLDEQGLPLEMTPAATLETFDLAEKALERLSQWDRLAAKAEAAEQACADYGREAATLCAGYREAELRLKEDAVSALHILHAEVSRHQQVSDNQRQLAVKRTACIERLTGLEAELQDIESRIGSVLDRFGAAQEADYIQALADRSLLDQLDNERVRLEVELSAGLMPDELKGVSELLEKTDEQELSELLESLKAQEAKLMHDQRELLERKGELKGALEGMTQAEERASLLTKREMLRTELDADLERYAVLTIAKALIQQTKRVYEEERQPVVLRHASSYFARLTEGRYIRVNAVSAREGLTVEDRGRVVLDSGMLSRGTAEQLYLAMRLALAKEASKDVLLPLLLDDLFVNFDASRRKAAVSLLAELSAERQILFFTCHPETRDLLLTAVPEAKLISLEPHTPLQGSEREAPLESMA
ncbi:AAA family ATPase [Paenibacillus sp. PL2-23]|uniref:AAA family ATPase n=1 Tax=Paenibacillus sp. PL2-23 TaxID=2100729 RepID=UPI0030FBC4B0